MAQIPSIVLKHLKEVDGQELFYGSPPKIESATGKTYFVKEWPQSSFDQCRGEVESLSAINTAASGLAPRVLDFSSDDGAIIFISEYKTLGRLTSEAGKRLGVRLATEVHRHTSPNGKYGFPVPTYCGATRLENGWHETWAYCFDAMIGGLLDRLGTKDVLRTKGQKIRDEVIPWLLGSLEIQPALLHGDLWSGNVGTDTKTGEPVIFDPSSYYGHNEAELSIATMFGGFPQSFFETYHANFPKAQPETQYELRQTLYQLFHYLNHTVLFNGHYASMAKEKMEVLLKAHIGKKDRTISGQVAHALQHCSEIAGTSQHHHRNKQCIDKIRVFARHRQNASGGQYN